MAKNIIINEKIYNDVLTFCEVNNIADVNKYCEYLLGQALLIEKYGTVPVIIKETNDQSSQNLSEKKEEKVIVKSKKNNDDYGVYD